MTLVILAATALAVVVWVAPAWSQHQRSSALESARARWEAADITHYTVDVTGGGSAKLCDHTLEVTPEGTTEIADIDPAMDYGCAAPLTVEAAFEWVEQHLKDDEFDVTYDAQLGYPTQLRARESRDCFHCSSWLSLTNFTPFEPAS